MLAADGHLSWLDRIGRTVPEPSADSEQRRWVEWVITAGLIVALRSSADR